MTTNTHDIGDARALTVEFKNRAGVLTDPTNVAVKVTAPDGTTTSKTDADPEVSNPSTGNWELAYTPSQAGRHFVNWKGTGAVEQAVSDEFYVLPDRVI